MLKLWIVRADLEIFETNNFFETSNNVEHLNFNIENRTNTLKKMSSDFQANILSNHQTNWVSFHLTMLTGRDNQS